MNKVFRNIFFFMLFLSLSAFMDTIKVPRYRLCPDHELKISGTSNLHDWYMISSSGQGEALILKNRFGKLESVQTLRIAMPALSLKSGKNQLDKSAYKALRACDFEMISFELNNIQNIRGNHFKALGNFEIAGEKRELLIDTEYELFENEVRFKGKTSFKLSDFNIDPPTVFLGAVKAGDEVVLSFNTKFKL